MVAAAPPYNTYPPAPPATARLQGIFAMDGRVTVASRVKGEHPGDLVRRAWGFSPTCATGVCPVVDLLRQRQGGVDRVTLHLRRPAYYVGAGTFYVPLHCGRRTIARGELASFTIAVTIDQAVQYGDVALASEIKASYTNPRRTNLTRCIAFPGHDAARYTGSIVTGQPPAES